MRKDKIKVGINGFGRIGRSYARVIAQHPEIELVRVNDLYPLASLKHLFKYDSIHGAFQGVLSESEHENALFINDCLVDFSEVSEIEDINWSGCQIVIEASGKYKSHSILENHLKNGASKVILAVPPEDDLVKMVVMGVNEHSLKPTDLIVSNASCTTNSAAHLIDVMNRNYQLEGCFITTVHSYTSDQTLHDAPHKDLRRARAASQSIIPTTTGAAKALTKVFPDLKEKLGGCGIRVPVPNGSLTDLTFTIANPPSATEVNELVKELADGKLKQFMQYSNAPLVSSDIIGNPHSCVFEPDLTSVVGNMVKLVGWYDNEIGYSNRLKDLTLFISQDV